MSNKYVDKAGLQDFAAKLNAKQKTIFALKSEVGSPLVAATAAAMTDTDKIYVYTGSEAGYVNGNWYYYDGDSWESGGVYNSTAFTTDTTLSNPGEAADAKVTGDDIRALQSDMAKKANKDGSYDTMNVGTAENLTPYSADAGVEQAIPFNLQGTGCGNGEMQVDTGPYCQLKEKRGNTVVVNQLIHIPGTSISKTQNNVTFTDNRDGTYTVQTTAEGASANTSLVVYSKNTGHGGRKALLCGTPSGGGNASYFLSDAWGAVGRDLGSGKIGNIYASGSAEITINVPSGSIITTPVVFRPKLIDLEQWFGSEANIPAYLLSHPEDFGRYYSGSLAYNAGTLTNADGGVLKTIGRNQWDEVTELGALDPTTGAEVATTSKIRAKNYVPVIPNTTYYKKTSAAFWNVYYDKNHNYIGYGNSNQGTFTTPTNAHYLRWNFESAYGVTYKNDVTISLYYEGESGYDEYYPYEELASINTGSETLRSAGEAYDSKTPDGTITRNIGVVDMGTLSFTYDSSSRFVANVSGIYQPSDASDRNKGFISAAYLPDTQVTLSNITDKTMLTASGKIYIKDSAYTDADLDAQSKASWLSGKYLHFKLETPTTESGTAFAETVTIDDFGSMQFVNTNGVPQGNLIFYPVDYKAFLDTAYNELDGDATQIAQKGELAVDDPDTLKGVINLINSKIPAAPGTDGVYKLTVTVSGGVATYSWEAVV